MFTLNLVRYLFKLDLLFFWVQEDGGGRRRKVVVRKRPQGVEAPQFSSQPGTDQAPPKGWRHRSSAHNQVQTKRP